MNLTTLFRLRKPEGTDPVNIEDFNDNFDVIDTELGRRPLKTDPASDMTVAFTQAANRANLATGEKLSVSLGKIMKFFADLKTVAFSGSYADLSNKPSIPSGTAADCQVVDDIDDIKAITQSGYVPGTLPLKQVISDLSFPDGVGFYPDIQNGQRGYNTDAARGADTFTPFSQPISWNSHGHYGYGCALDTSNYRYLEITSHVAIHVFHSSGYKDYENYAPRYSDTNYGENILIAAIAADVTQVIDVSQYDIIIFSAQNNVGGSSGQNLNSTIAWGRMYN